MLQRVAACCSMLQRVAACCSVLQHVAVRCNVIYFDALCCSVLQCAAGEEQAEVGGALSCDAFLCSMLWHVAACSSVF